MKYLWFNIINLNDFDALEICDYSFSVYLEDKGEQTFRLLKGFNYSIAVDGQYLTPYLNGKNGFNKNKRSAYIDADRNLWVGYEAEN